jgi:nitroreductase
MVDIHPVLRNRTSGVAFSDAPLEPEKIESLLEAFRWAPSSRNAQPWRLIVVQSPEAHQKFDESLSENNQKWATQAPIKMIILGNPEEQPDRNGQNRWLLDVGLALENLLLQGCDMGLTVHALAGWDEDMVLKNFNIPTPLRVAALFAVGYPGKVEELSEELQQKARQPQVRKPLEEIVSWDTFGQVVQTGL